MSSNRKPFPPHSDVPPENVHGFKTIQQAWTLPASVTDFSQQQVHDLIKFLIKAITEIRDTTGDFLLHMDDGRVIDTKSWNSGWEWTHGIGLYGIYNFWTMTGDKQAYDVMIDWFEPRLKQGTPSKNINTVSPFLTLANLYEADSQGRRAWKSYIESWSDFLMRRLPRTEEGGFQHIVYNSVNEGQLWDDTLMMSVLPLAKFGLLLNRPDYVEEAKRQTLLHIKYLVDNKTGLWVHGWEFINRTTFAGALWARGNCWITMFIPEFIDLLKLQPGDALREHLVATLVAQIKALERYQDPNNGMWHTLLDDPTSYVESSATAGFCFGILLSLRLAIIPQEYIERFTAVAMKALAATVSQIDDEGQLQNTSFGTAIGHTLEHYRTVYITPMPYGTSLAICAIGEFLRTYL
ncbi:hypothetical protein OIO90_004884 [Microbotryomycetes sp. JL221]|nr:hypothetical protein OIO90_004884 [Microbotryomycetes sp. JL221]